MTQALISKELQEDIREFLQGNRQPELVNTYLFYLQKRFD
ncbi:MAG: DUF2709 domain-containing protein, partial [Chlamydiia bacterium]|nr:DUF2709 domain-containing protein [Chlamydiia bacterium]